MLNQKLTPSDIEHYGTISLDWLKSLEADSLATATLTLVRITESGIPPSAIAIALRIWYRTLTGTTYTEAVTKAATESNISRNYVLKGLKILQQLNMVTCFKRPGLTDEYKFTNIDQWQEYVPPIPSRDGSNKVVQLPTNNPVENLTEPIPDRDDLVEDTNSTVVTNNLITTTNSTVNVPIEDAPVGSRWKYVGQGLPRVFLPGELDERTGQMIEQLHSKTQRPCSCIIKDGVALMYEREFGTAVEVMKSDKSLDAIAQTSESLAIRLPRENELKLNGVVTSNSLLQAAARANQDGLKTAVDAFLEYAASKKLEKPTRCLIKAIEQDWKPQQKADVEVDDADCAGNGYSKNCPVGEVVAASKPVESFSHVETNPRATVASLIIQGQYQRAAILAGLYGVDYQEVVEECGLGDDPNAAILFVKATKK